MSLQGHVGIYLPLILKLSLISPFAAHSLSILGLTSYCSMQKTNIYKNRVTQGRGVIIFHFKYSLLCAPFPLVDLLSHSELNHS